MNVYCFFCEKEMEIIEDLGSVIKVIPCGCKGEESETDKDYLRDEIEEEVSNELRGE